MFLCFVFSYLILGKPLTENGVPRTDARTNTQRLDNIYLVLGYLRDTDTPLFQVRPVEVAAGDPAAILDMIWAIVVGTACTVLDTKDEASLCYMISNRVNSRMPSYLAMKVLCTIALFVLFVIVYSLFLSSLNFHYRNHCSVSKYLILKIQI